MRQGQQNRRGRGRNNNNNNRKNQNPLSRSFESNGPDVKIRGTPAHIAEKYMALARDAQSSGDHVLAENYLQHAEHYNRIIMAYREQFAPHGEGMNGHRQPHGEGGASEDATDEDAAEDILDEGFQPQPHLQGGFPSQQHRQNDGNRFDGNRDNNREHRQDRPFRRDQDRFRNRDRQMRDDRPQRDDRQDRQQRDDRPQREDRAYRDDRPQREERAPREERAAPEVASEQPEPRRPQRERFQQQHEQPDFLRRPVRRPRAEPSEAPAVAKEEPSSD